MRSCSSERNQEARLVSMDQQQHHQKLDLNVLKKAPVVMVMVPFPAQGHLNQFLHFSRLISAFGIPVHYVGSATHNHQAKHRVHGWDPLTISNIHFHDFPIPPFVTPQPNPHTPNRLPVDFQPVFEASSKLREPLLAFLRSLSPTTRRIVIVHDSLMAFTAQDATSLPNAEAYTLNVTSTFALFTYIWEFIGKPTMPKTVIPNDISYEGCFADEIKSLIASQFDFSKFDSGDLYNTCRPIEGKFIDLLGQKQFSLNKRKWAVGPLNPVVLSGSRNSNRRHECLEWLDKQAPRSVLYISFGTTTSMPDDQIIELAMGLERSNQRFIWVLRDAAHRGDIYAGEEARKAQLPNGYEEKIEGVGLIVREWAPQLEILAHPSTGGFLSHCGWNSCIESISMGVSIVAWPMHSDQPRNTTLVTEVLRIGVIVREWAQRDELVSSAMIENAINKLMASEEGEGMKRRAEELGGAVRESMSEGGTSRVELESFIAHITR
ncbi:hypothetical protein HHK36_017263 [Tetracentron sinense]|uniref:Glycosyltransferase N-terminal domain-containing protein n=1 Tax=Tetracentron sinense TaxID=13715 RepID=A0A834Z459_TETSI|nr:hypothetical protein HHK36_017263 [Tetracentron sinense]